MGNDTVINDRIAAIAHSSTLAITSRAKQMAADGQEIFSFAAGEPDFHTPAHIKAAAVRALEAGETKYAPNAGIPALRKAIAEKLKRDNGLSYEAEQVSVWTP